MFSYILRVCGFALIILMPAALPARAEVDADQFLNALKTALATNGIELNAKSAAKNGADIVVTGAELVQAGTPDKNTDLGDLTFEHVTEKDGGYVIGQLSRPPGVQQGPDGSWKFSGFRATNVAIPPPGSPGLIFYDSIVLGASTFVANDGKEIMKIGEMAASMSQSAPGQPIAFEFKPVTFEADMSAIPSKDNGAMLATFGLTTFKAKFYAKGTWDMASGRVQTPVNTFEIENIGKFNISADISGYTPDTITAFGAMVRRIAPKKANSGDEKVSLADKDLVSAPSVFEKLTLNAMSIRFDDASVTGKILEEVSKNTGQEKAALVEQAKAMTTLGLLALQDPDFVVSASKAVAAYLDNPKNIEIKIAPKEPVPMTLFMGMAGTDPKALIRQLNVQVIANQ